jgi:multimeric flavodoxin WrbA
MRRNRRVMKVLGISGSPRVSGNTAFAVQYALSVIEGEGAETKYISLADQDIRPCVGCWKCEKSYACWQEDYMTEILDAMFWCDGLLIGSPVYFGMISGQLKVMMDRTIPMRPNYGDELPMAGKVGGAIACAASRSGGQETTLQNIHTYMLQMNMLVISDGPDYSHSGGTIMKEAKDDEWGLETVRNLSRNMVRMLRSTRL